MQIRPATFNDLHALQQIRNHYILHSQATFDEAPLSMAHMQIWFANYAEQGPHRLLVAEEDGQLCAYACSQTYRTHPAFSKTVETSIYVAPGHNAKGLGSKLYDALFAALEGLNLHTALVGIALPNPGSVQLHKKFGFSEVGIFSEYAHKHGKPISSLWMQKMLCPGSTSNNEQQGHGE